MSPQPEPARGPVAHPEDDLTALRYELESCRSEIARLRGEREQRWADERRALRRLVNDLATDVGGVRFDGAAGDDDWMTFDGRSWVPLADYDPDQYRLLLSCTRPDLLA